MKTYYKQIAILVIAGLLAACASSEKKEKKPGEPNNSILKAGLLKSGKPYSMKIDSIGDIDWYAIPATGPGYVKISTKAVPENLGLEVRFAEKQAWKPEKQKWLTGWENIPKTLSVEKADTLYFAIIDDHNNKASKEKIEFKAEFIEEFDEYEPNNNPENAILVTSGKPMKTIFFPKTDQDWFKIKIEKPGYLMFQARSLPKDIKAEVRYAKKGSAYGKAEFMREWQDLPAGIQVSEPGVYHFVLIDDYHNAMSRDKAEWKIDFISEMDPTEPNNGFEEAYLAAIGDTIKTSIFPEGDTDFFTLKPDSTVTVRLAPQSPEDINPEVRLHVKKDFEVKAVGGWTELPANFELGGGKQYYFQLVDDYNNAYSTEPVILKIIELKLKKPKKDPIE